jgi:uncharacterized repeat protein (TIGR03837 family)
MLWDLFCRVIDNYGDIGVCWRLAADLASRGERVRLWADDPSPLDWMAPGGTPGVAVVAWHHNTPVAEPGDVVIEAFGCDPPDAFVSAMAARPVPPVWINLEYLSAEAASERNHGLPSPLFSGPGAGLVKRFFYPGFTPSTGGLLREPDLLARQRSFDAAAWLQAQGLARQDGETVVSLFCYANAALPSLLEAFAAQPTLLLTTPGPAAQQVSQALGPGLRRGALRAALLPHLSQTDYDHLLWASELNFVRGEDSFVRAQWAGRPFIWQIYPQQGGVHRAKLDAFLERFPTGPERDAWAAWNGLSSTPIVLPPLAQWQQRCIAWREALLAQADLCSQLVGLVTGHLRESR